MLTASRIFISILVTFSITVAGCSSIVARTGENSQLGKTYSGVSYSAETLFLCNVRAIYFPPALLVTVPLTALDLVLTSIADTVIYPIDVLNDGRKIKGYPENFCDYGH